MAMNKAAMKAKVAAAYTARTGLTMSEGDFNVLVDLCQGIIEEIIAGATISVTVTGVQPGGGSAVGTGTVNS